MSYKNVTVRKIDVPEQIDINKTSASKSVCFAIVGTWKMLDLNLKHIFVINVMIYWWLLMD